MKGNHKPTGFSLTISETQKILTNFNIHQKLAVFSRKSLEQGQKGTARPSDPAPHPFLAPVSMSECEQDTASAAAPTSNHNEDGDNEEAGSEAAEFVSLPPPLEPEPIKQRHPKSQPTDEAPPEPPPNEDEMPPPPPRIGSSQAGSSVLIMTPDEIIEAYERALQVELSKPINELSIYLLRLSYRDQFGSIDRADR